MATGILRTVPSTRVVLSQKVEKVEVAAGLPFLRRFREFMGFINEDPAISVGVNRIRNDYEEALARFGRVEEGNLFGSFKACRDDLVVQVPEVDDSGVVDPDEGLRVPLMDRPKAIKRWRKTLSNFDAILEGDGRIDPIGLDDTRSLTLYQILSHKIFSLKVVPGSDDWARRVALQSRIMEIRREHDEAWGKLQDAAESCGYATLRRLEVIASRLGGGGLSDDYQLRYIEEMLSVEVGDLGRVSEAVDLELVADEKMADTVASYEGTIRGDLQSLLSSLSPTLDGLPRFGDLDTNQKLTVVGIGFSALGSVVGAAVAIAIGG
jgi:hypothetical protein